MAGDPLEMSESEQLINDEWMWALKISMEGSSLCYFYRGIFIGELGEDFFDPILWYSDGVIGWRQMRRIRGLKTLESATQNDEIADP